MSSDAELRRTINGEDHDVNRHRLWAAALALITAALIVAGCGSASTSTGGGVALKASDLNAQPRDKVKDGGVLRWAIDEFPSNWNYNQVDGTLGAAYDVEAALMPTTFNVDEKANVTPNLDYLVSAKVTSTTPQVITYELNRKARWSDGKPITAADYIAQWKALRSATSDYQVSSSTGYESISSTTVGKDAYEVVTTYSKPFADWQSIFNPLYPASANATAAAFNKGWINKIPVTAGPFKLEKIDQTAQLITVVRDPAWWGKPAKLDKIVFRTLASDAIVSSFANGEVDFGEIGPDPSGYKRALGVTGGAVREAGGPDFRHFTMNGASPMLSDQRVRQAFTLGVDRQVIARADLTGLNWPTATLDNHFLVNTQAGYKDNTGGLGTYDTAKAGTLLDDAGWKLNGAFREKGGKQLKLRFVIPAGVPTSKQEGELVQGMMKKIGVNLDLQTVPSDAFFDKYVTPGNFDITAFSWIGTPFPISSAQSIYAKPTKDAKGELQIQQNYARTGTAAIDKLMGDAATTLDKGKALDLINQADAQLWQLGHSLTLYQRPQLLAVKATLANLGAFGFKSPVYEAMGFGK